MCIMYHAYTQIISYFIMPLAYSNHMYNTYISTWMSYMEKYEHDGLCIGFHLYVTMNMERHICMYVCKGKESA